MFVYNDGGRAEAGFKGKTGDCAARAVAIATGLSYKRVYNDLAKLNKSTLGKKSVRHGTMKEDVHNYLIGMGFTWVATMKFGQGCKTHLTKDELPKGRIVTRLSKHFAACIDGVLHDTYDSSRSGTRCVYGYWIKP